MHGLTAYYPPMPGSPRMASVAIGALLLLVLLGGCGGGSDSVAGNTEQAPAAVADPAGDPTAAAGDDPARAPAEPEAGKRPEADVETEAEQGGGGDRDGGSAGAADGKGGEEQFLQSDPEPRALRELHAEVMRQLGREDPRSLEELTEQIRREARIDSCPQHLRGSDLCRERP